MFLISMIVQEIANVAIKGIMKIAGITFTPAIAIAIIFAIKAVINNERKISTMGAVRYPYLFFFISNKPATKISG